MILRRGQCTVLHVIAGAHALHTRHCVSELFLVRSLCLRNTNLSQIARRLDGGSTLWALEALTGDFTFKFKLEKSRKVRAGRRLLQPRLWSWARSAECTGHLVQSCPARGRPAGCGVPVLPVLPRPCLGRGGGLREVTEHSRDASSRTCLQHAGPAWLRYELVHPKVRRPAALWCSWSEAPPACPTAPSHLLTCMGRGEVVRGHPTPL